MGDQVWAGGCVFAVGDCNAVSSRSEIPAMPKTGYVAEQQAVHACRNIISLDKQLARGGSRKQICCLPARPSEPALASTWYPWGAGIYAVSLGPEDGCVIVGV